MLRWLLLAEHRWSALRERQHAADMWQRGCLRNPRAWSSACLIRVSISAFVRFWRIWRKRESDKFFVFNNQQWFESHPLRQPSL